MIMEHNGKGSPDQAQPTTLNIVFHGLWAYEVDKDGITAYTPKQEDHAVAAGGWTPEVRLEEGRTYRISGLDAGTASDFEKSVNAIFYDRQLSNTEDLFCRVKLPLPKGIHSLRAIRFNKPPYTGEDSGLVHTRAISTVQVFIYDAKLPIALEEESDSTSEKPKTELQPAPGAPNIANLFFFSQPDGRVHAHHFETAFAKLAGLFELRIVPVASMSPGPPDPKVPGLTWKDLVGLNERAHSERELVPAGGLSGANCDPFVIDNRETAGGHGHHPMSS